MRLLLVIVILFASLTAPMAQAADICLSHECAVMQDAGNNDGGQPLAADDCPDCLHHCHGSCSVIGDKTASLLPIDRGDVVFPFTDDFPPDSISSGPLKPPRNA